MGKLVTVKDAVNDAAMEIGITQRPITTAVGSLDQDIAQMTALLSAVAAEVMDEQPYTNSLGDGQWLVSADGQTMRDKPLMDDDLILFDARLAINGLKFRFLKAKGLEFGEDMRDFTTRLNKLGGRANGRVLDLNEDWGRQQ